MTKRQNVPPDPVPSKDVTCLNVLYTQSYVETEKNEGEEDHQKIRIYHTHFTGVTLGVVPSFGRHNYSTGCTTFSVPTKALAGRLAVLAVVGYYDEEDSGSFYTKFSSVDMTHVIGVYGNFAKAQAVAEAIESRDEKRCSQVVEEQSNGLFSPILPWQKSNGLFSPSLPWQTKWGFPRLTRVVIHHLPILGEGTNPVDTNGLPPNLNDIPSW